MKSRQWGSISRIKNPRCKIESGSGSAANKEPDNRLKQVDPGILSGGHGNIKPTLQPKEETNDSGSFGMPEKAFALSFCATVDAGELKPGMEAVARYFGGSRYSADSKTKERIGTAIDQACRIASPMLTIAINPIKPSVLERTLKLPGGQSLPLPDCAGDLSVRYLAAAIGTLGKELEMECRHLAVQHRIYQSTLLDAVGTAMLEAMDANICTRIDAECHPLGLCIGVRFAPGLNGYPMDHQKTLFQLADGFSIDVRMNADFMMEPIKTISFFTLLGQPNGESRQPDKCRLCRLTHCQFRKAATAEMEGETSWPNKC